MKIKLKDNTHIIDNWYNIVRAEHDGQEWSEEVGSNCFQYMASERLSPEACIEGDFEEILSIAVTIKVGGGIQFKRCAVSVDEDGVRFWSPKNSEQAVVISFEDAEEFADEVIAFSKEKQYGTII